MTLYVSYVSLMHILFLQALFFFRALTHFAAVFYILCHVKDNHVNNTLL
jgi:hypothetical protein